MSPILGIWASAQQPALQSSFDSIATQTVGAGGASSITFSSIPSTYKHLQIRYITRCSIADLDRPLVSQFNSDTATNYAYHFLRGDGSTTSASAGTSATFNYHGSQVGNTNTASVFNGGVIDILDYADTNKFKTTRTLNGFDKNGATGYIEFTSSLWRSTTAINAIKLYTTEGNLMQYSTFALYGVKG